jgi:hypothetical protein
MVTGIFALFVFPSILLMAIWTTVNVGRLLFPEEDLPFDAAARRARARRRGQAVPVRAYDIVDDLRRRPVRPVMPRREAVAEGEQPGGTTLSEDLWLRRN